MDKTQIIMNTIKWVNDTFVPKGLTPIEDLPKAAPGEGNYCVFAKVLNTVPAFDNVTVGYRNIELNVHASDFSVSDIKSSAGVLDYFDWDENGYATDSTFEIPEDVQTFISNFDRGEYPELMDEDDINNYVNDGEFKEKMVEAIEHYRDGNLPPITFYS